jgi:hypothetical protein
MRCHDLLGYLTHHLPVSRVAAIETTTDGGRSRLSARGRDPRARRGKLEGGDDRRELVACFSLPAVVR